MSTVDIRCPNCGSICHKTETSDEYVCTHCGTRFRFIDPTFRVVAQDVRSRYCPICGRPISPEKSYRCTRCNRTDFCTSCIERVSGKYVCQDCIAEAGESCDFCRNYAYYKCGICGKKSCRVHAYDHFLVQKGSDYLLLMCETCGNMAVCSSCANPKLFGGFSCRKCNGTLEVVSKVRR